MRVIRMGVLALAAAAGTASADYTSNFERPLYNGTAAGTLLEGQDGWFTPVTTPVTNPANVHTYAGNTYGFVQNPAGNEQFVVTRNNGTSLGRGQHNIDFSGLGTWTISWDQAVVREGVLPALQNVGSFSLQNSATERYFQSLYTWDDVATGAAFDSNYIWFNSAGVQNGTTGALPGPEWDALALNTWYRHTVVVNMSANQILSVSIENLHTNVVATVNPADAYLHGGANPTRPLPTGFRLFSGGGLNVTNNVGWDNVNLVPAPGTLALLGLGGLVSRRRRR